MKTFIIEIDGLVCGQECDFIDKEVDSHCTLFDSMLESYYLTYVRCAQCLIGLGGE